MAIPIYDTLDEAKKTETLRIRDNYDAGKRGKQIREGVNTKIKVGDKTYKTVNATKTGKRLQPLVGMNGVKPRASGMTDAQKRQLQGRGVYKGEFVDGTVIRWAKKLNLPKNQELWPVDKTTGKPKSIKGFMQKMNKGWQEAGYDLFMRMNEDGGVEIHRGHAFPSQPESGVYAEGGSDWKYGGNISPQGARTAYQDETGRSMGSRGQSANIAQSDTLLKNEAELKAAGIEGKNVREAFADYMVGDDPNVLKWTRFGKKEPEVISRVAHEVGARPEAALAEEELKLRKREFDAELSKVNAEPPKVKANRAFKVFRRLARAAGTSNNPIANISGDMVGVIMDGVAFAQNPKDPSNLVDLGLSGTQALASIGALGLTFVPIPGARAGAFFLMKAGDKVATLERLYNMGGREGLAMATKPDILKIIKKNPPLTEGDAKMYQSIWEEQNGISKKLWKTY